tara:strand:- start:619 stop:852 length:234 start_codon:yes stop_codon:yes gene_type:complete
LGLLLIKKKNMKSWFINLFVKQIFTSKKFIYAISSVIIPIITNALSVDEQTSTNLFIALLSLAGFQGLADFGSAKKK